MMPAMGMDPADAALAIDVKITFCSRSSLVVVPGVEALLSSFSDEWISWRTPGLAHAVAQVFQAMSAFSERENRVSDAEHRSSLRS